MQTIRYQKNLVLDETAEELESPVLSCELDIEIAAELIGGDAIPTSEDKLIPASQLETLLQIQVKSVARFQEAGLCLVRAIKVHLKFQPGIFALLMSPSTQDILARHDVRKRQGDGRQ